MCHPLSFPFFPFFLFSPKTAEPCSRHSLLLPSFCFSFLFYIFYKLFQREKQEIRVNISVTHFWVNFPGDKFQLILEDFGPEVVAWHF